MNQLWKCINDEQSETLDRVRTGVVQILNNRRGAGTGFFVAREGLILTNAHVVHQSYPRVQLPNGERMSAQVLTFDPTIDLALLQVETVAAAPLVFAEEKVKPGEWVLAVGYPWGMKSASTAGIVVQSRALYQQAPSAVEEWIVSDLHLAPGNSGGPLVNRNGNVIGVNTMLGPGAWE